MAMEGITTITDRNLGELVGHDRAVLILSKSDCGSCASYAAEIEERQETGELADVAVGKLVLDAPGAGKFKLKNPWIGKLKTLPYTLLFVDGKPVEHFAASKASYLVEKLEAVEAAA